MIKFIMIFIMTLNSFIMNNIPRSVDYYFKLLPKNVQEAFYKDDWHYEKVDYDLGQKFYDGTKVIYGLTDFEVKTIYIDDDLVANKVILHEVGHRFEYEPYMQGPYCKEFTNLYNDHWTEWYLNYGGHINNYYTPSEAYAQCYEIYFLRPECLDTDTYDFISQEISKIK